MTQVCILIQRQFSLSFYFVFLGCLDLRSVCIFSIPVLFLFPPLKYSILIIGSNLQLFFLFLSCLLSLLLFLLIGQHTMYKLQSFLFISLILFPSVFFGLSRSYVFVANREKRTPSNLLCFPPSFPLTACLPASAVSFLPLFLPPSLSSS